MKFLNIPVPDEFHERLRRYSFDCRVSMAEMVRRGLEHEMRAERPPVSEIVLERPAKPRKPRGKPSHKKREFVLEIQKDSVFEKLKPYGSKGP